MAVLIAVDERLKHLFYHVIRVWPAEPPSLLVLNYEGIYIYIYRCLCEKVLTNHQRSPAPLETR